MSPLLNCYNFQENVHDQVLFFSVSGLHAVADIYCDCCKTTLGWKYEQAYESSQKYKEGKFIIELAHMIKENGWENESWSLQQTDKLLSGSEKFRPILFYWFRFYFMKVFFFFVQCSKIEDKTSGRYSAKTDCCGLLKEKKVLKQETLQKKALQKRLIYSVVFPPLIFNDKSVVNYIPQGYQLFVHKCFFFHPELLIFAPLKAG